MPIWRLVTAPFRIHETELPPNLLLIAKLVLLGLVLKGYHTVFPDVFAPLIPWLDWIPSPYLRRTLQLSFVIGAAGLLLNRAVRTSCLILGAVFIIGTLSARVYYRNATFFVGLVFVMIGLQDRNRPTTLLPWQLGLMYLGAGLNKLLEPDWRTGQFFAYLLGDVHATPLYTVPASWFPQGWFAWFLCWQVIASELASGALFFIPRLRRLAVWLAAAMHTGASLMTTNDYGIYLSAVLATYLVVLEWPDSLIVRCRAGVASWLVGLHRLSHADDRSVRYESSAGAMEIEVPGGTYAGFGAFWRLALWTPVLYIVAMAIMTSVRGALYAPMIQAAGVLVGIALVLTATVWLRKRLSRS